MIGPAAGERKALSKAHPAAAEIFWGAQEASVEP